MNLAKFLLFYVCLYVIWLFCPDIKRVKLPNGNIVEVKRRFFVNFH